MKVLVTGGRTFALPAGTCIGDLAGDGVITNVEAAEQFAIVCEALDATNATVIIHGDAKGADQAAARWAVSRSIPTIVCPADWQSHGKYAGAIRNQEMLNDHKPDLVVAFPGGAGTADMVSKAQRAMIPVRFVNRTKPISKGRLF